MPSKACSVALAGAGAYAAATAFLAPNAAPQVNQDGEKTRRVVTEGDGTNYKLLIWIVPVFWSSLFFFVSFVKLFGNLMEFVESNESKDDDGMTSDGG